MPSWALSATVFRTQRGAGVRRGGHSSRGAVAQRQADRHATLLVVIGVLKPAIPQAPGSSALQFGRPPWPRLNRVTRC